MAVEVEFWDFPKMENSTKIPSTAGTKVPCIFKDSPFTLETPSVILSKTVGDSISGRNYAKISRFNRYYFCDWQSLGDRWLVNMRVDVMASYKAAVASSTQYVTRAASDYHSAIPDGLYPTTSEPSVTLQYGKESATSWGNANPFGVTPYSSGTYVLGIVSNDASSVGAVTYYAMNNANLKRFLSLLLGDYQWATGGQAITEISDSLFKALFNPSQYIASAMWFPRNDAFTGTSTTTIKYGWYEFTDSSLSVRKLTGFIDEWSFSIDLPKHPQTSTLGYYVKGSPYSRYTLYWPCFGQFPLDANVLLDSDYITVQGQVDAVSGITTLRVVSEHNRGRVVETQCQVGIPIQLAQGTGKVESVAAILGGVAGVAGGIATGNYAGALGSAMSGIDAAKPQVTQIGNNGTAATYGIPPVLQCEFYPVVGTSNARNGRPLCEERTISSLSGFIMCERPKVEISGSIEELSQILDKMERGFYYE